MEQPQPAACLLALADDWVQALTVDDLLVIARSLVRRTEELRMECRKLVYRSARFRMNLYVRRVMGMHPEMEQQQESFNPERLLPRPKTKRGQKP